jgi:hypothetical protein
LKDASERIGLNVTIKYPDGKRVSQVLYTGATFTAVRGVASLQNGELVCLQS